MQPPSSQKEAGQDIFSCPASFWLCLYALSFFIYIFEQDRVGGDRNRASVELSVTSLVIIGLIMLQLLFIAALTYCCLTLPFHNK